MKRMVIATALVLALASPVQADLKAGLDAYYDEDFATAVRELRPLAEGGVATAQYRLGLMYDFGQGVTKDPEEAARWHRLAAQQGDADAQFALGLMYELGRGVKHSLGDAFAWIRLASYQGHLDAQHWLSNKRGGEGRGGCPGC